MKTMLVFACLLIASCTTQAPYKNDLILPSDALISECVISPPPNLSGDAEKDKLILAGAWSLQTNNLGKCNQKLKTLQIWKTNTAKRMGLM